MKIKTILYDETNGRALSVASIHRGRDWFAVSRVLTIFHQKLFIFQISGMSQTIISSSRAKMKSPPFINFLYKRHALILCIFGCVVSIYTPNRFYYEDGFAHRKYAKSIKSEINSLSLRQKLTLWQKNDQIRTVRTRPMVLPLQIVCYVLKVVTFQTVFHDLLNQYQVFLY